MMHDFQIEELVEQDSGTVSYKAYNSQSGRKCKVKRYLMDDLSGLGKVAGWQEEFLRLIEEFTQMESPHLPTLLGGGIDPQDGSPYLVYQWIDSSSLKDILHKHGELDQAVTRQLLEDALRATETLHNRGLLHGDLSPRTIHYTDAEGERRWLVDWDLIRSLRCRYQVQRWGVDAYVAPELREGGGPTVQSDLYSLGKVAEIMVEDSGRNPLAAWLKRMTESEAGYRFGSAGEAMAELLREERRVSNPVLNVGAVGEAPPERSPLKSSRSGVPPMMIILILALLAGTGVGGYFLLKQRGVESVVTVKSEELSAEPEKLGNAEPVSPVVEEKEPPAVRMRTDFNPETEVLRPEELALAETLLGQVVKLRGVVKEINQSSSKKTTYLYFDTAGEYERRTAIWLEAKTASVFGDTEISEIAEDYLNKEIQIKTEMRHSKRFYREGYYLKVEKRSELEILGS